MDDSINDLKILEVVSSTKNSKKGYKTTKENASFTKYKKSSKYATIGD